MAANAPFLTTQLKLLIVDDSNVMRRRIERCQQIEHLQVVGLAANGVEAIEIFRRTDPDVVTMDITMPEMDGIECVEQLVDALDAVHQIGRAHV